MYFDAHLHLDHLTKDELSAYINKSKEYKVDYLLSNSTDFKSNLKHRKISDEHKEIIPGYGLFPLNVSQTAMQKLEKFLTRQNKFFIGEIGLDFKFVKEEKDKVKQIQAFEKLLDLAKEYDVFVEIHSRFAIRKVMEILEKKKQDKVIMHWFTNSKKYVNRAVANGYYITAGATYLLNDNIKNIVNDIDKDKILFETDFPIRLLGTQYGSWDIPKIAKRLSKDFDLSLKDIEKNQQKVFKKIIK